MPQQSNLFASPAAAHSSYYDCDVQVSGSTSDRNNGRHRRNHSDGRFPSRAVGGHSHVIRDSQKENVGEDGVIDLVSPEKVPTRLLPADHLRSPLSSPSSPDSSIEILNPNPTHLPPVRIHNESSPSFTINRPTAGFNRLFDDEDEDIITPRTRGLRLNDSLVLSQGNFVPLAETPEQRRVREEEESEELARQLMAEEAMASYAASADFLTENAGNYSEEDLAALRAAMAEEDPHEGIEGSAFAEEEQEGDLSYDTLVRLGERLGDVRQERWQMRAQSVIDTLPVHRYGAAFLGREDEGGSNDSLLKCLVCQCQYEDGERLRELPCGHFFHVECVDQWLHNKDICPYCRQSIVDEN